MNTWGLPAVNTLILLSSGASVTWAHWALKDGSRRTVIIGLTLTVALGVLFLVCQALEYGHAYHELNLKLSSGIYGSTFFMLTGFHGAHVTLGTIMLFVILIRCIKGHFTKEHHFGFEAAAWYWHFVDVVWLGLFVFVYWL
jgi:cytochrome c oxidase subunit 3